MQFISLHVFMLSYMTCFLFDFAHLTGTYLDTACRVLPPLLPLHLTLTTTASSTTTTFRRLLGTWWPTSKHDQSACGRMGFTLAFALLVSLQDAPEQPQLSLRNPETLQTYRAGDSWPASPVRPPPPPHTRALKQKPQPLPSKGTCCLTPGHHDRDGLTVTAAPIRRAPGRKEDVEGL